MKLRACALAFALLLGVVVALWLRFQPLSANESGYRLELDLLSSDSQPTGLQYDIGHGWNYRDHQVLWVTESAQPRTYAVALPPGLFRAFAIEPPPETHQILAGARIIAPDGAVAAKIPAIPDAPDRKEIVIRPAKPLELFAPDEKSWLGSALDFVFCVGAVLLLNELYRRRSSTSLQSRLLTAAQRVHTWAEARPGATLFIVAVLAVAVSCHPVVFFGKSYVSPDNGILCLYDVQPTLPGMPVEATEPWSGSDINATMWEHLPYSVAAHEAVFQDHEWPLWLRDDMGGLTLLGQGLSMIGDPLYWLTVFADGASWAWDVRFLLSKLLFCFGLGLVVWRSVRHLGVAALLAFSCAFIGYFSFRFNHPASLSLCYSPWILLCWIGAAEAPTLRRAGWWMVALIAANWLEFNTGTLKEASMLMLGLNAAGGLAILFQSESWTIRGKKLGLGALSCICFFALSAPLWVIFLDALKNGYTLYDEPRANQLAPGLFIGLFDDLFFRQLMEKELHVDPALNCLALLGVCWALASVRAWLGNPIGKAVLVISVFSVAMAFAIIPPAVIDHLPFFKNIIHIDDVFICVAVVPLFVLASFGLRNLLQTSDWQRVWMITLAILAGIAALYFGTVQAVPSDSNFALQLTHPAIFSPFFLGYASALLLAVALIPPLLRMRGPLSARILALVVCLAAIHFRHSQWLETKFDDYVVNPKTRVNLQARSPAVEFVRQRQSEPGRSMGFGQILRPGFNTALHLESVTGVDPVAPHILAEWYEASGLRSMAMWWPTVTKDNVAARQRIYDAMNVRYYFGSAADAATPAPGLNKMAAADLDIFESKSAWPRAFFTDRLGQYQDVRQLLQLVKTGDGRPFAAAQTGSPNLPTLQADQASRQLAAAHDYRLTSNTTSFIIDAPASGIAVLNESFVPENFRAFVNGQPVPYFQVNHIFKGVALPAAGTYHIEFDYWPHALTATLWIALAGLLVTIGGVAALSFVARAPQTPLPPETARVPAV